MQNSRAIKILIADGHAIVASGVAKILEGIPEFLVVGLAKNGEEAFRLFEQYSPDVVSIDLDLPGSISGMEVIRRLHQKLPHTHIIILTNLLDETTVQGALREGVAGYLLKNSTVDELVHAIHAAYQGTPTVSPEITQILIKGASMPGGYRLTSREQEVLVLLSQGLNNHEIAEQLSISLSTTQFHVSNILNKLGVHNRIEAATFAIRHRLAS
jgi:two-component system, NarL family, response regulator LiaR